MGRDKLGLQVGGLPLIVRACEALAAHCDEILLVGLPEPFAARDGLSAARLVSDLRPGREGPLSGIEAGLSAARYDRVFVAAGDMPFISARLVTFLLDVLSGNGVRAAVPRYRGQTHPLCAAYSRKILPEVRSALDGGVRSVRTFLDGLEGVLYVEELTRFGAPELFLMNVNAPEDLRRARGMFGEEAP